MAYGDNGPRAGRTTGRARNTLVNNQSKNVPAPLLSPTQTLDFGLGMAQLQMTLGERLAALKAGKGQIFAQYKLDRADVRSQRIANMAGTVNNALDRGIVGSSIDYAGRAGVEAEAARGIQEAIQARVSGLMGLRLERTSAFNDYYTGQFGLQAQQAAAQSEAATQAFLNDLVMRLGDETVPGGATPPTGPPARQLSAPEQAALDYVRNRLAAGRM